MGKLLVFRIKEKGMKGDRCYEYKNSVNLNDPNSIAIVFIDLESYGVPIRKAIKIFLGKEEKIFPFHPD